MKIERQRMLDAAGHRMGTLRFRLGLLVFAAVVALAIFTTVQFDHRLTHAYRDAGRTELTSIATTLASNFGPEDLQNPEALQRRVRELKEGNATLHKIGISWRDRTGRTLTVQAGHEHDPDGVKRNVSTSRAEVVPSNGKLAPIDEGVYGLGEKRAKGGAHYLRMVTPIRRSGRLIAAIELHYDLKLLDYNLARDKRTVAIAAILAAITLMLLVNFVLGRTLLTPLSRLQKAARRIGAGEVETRLNWHRTDEIGALAADFDRMAEQLEGYQSHLEELALTDPLTGLLNHRAFQERLEQELRRAERENYNVAVVALDVDYFKQVNDRWGHAAGDEGLRKLAKAIRHEVRPSDICGRVGGDEFVLAIVRATAEQAEELVQRLSGHISVMEFGPAGEHLTISAGISEFPRHSLSQDELMHLADGAMYWAKSGGRNRTRVYTTEANMALSPEEAVDRAAQAGLVNTVHALAKAVDAKDGYTHSHSHRVARYAAALAESMKIKTDRVEEIRTAGVLHDVGKIGIPDALLLKPAKLDDTEFATMRRHSELGRDIIAGAGMHEIAKFVLHLHERFDGKGYPEGLSSQHIPLQSRILHVADALEAMTSSRVYREALPVEEALAELQRGAGTQFDPALVAIMLELVRSGGLRVGSDDDEDQLDEGDIISSLGVDLGELIDTAPANGAADTAGAPDLIARFRPPG